MLPQPPQLATSESGFTQPPLQGTRGGTHWKPHVDDAHVATAPTGAEQAWPQEPQFWAFATMSTQAPSQIVRPLAQDERHPVAVHSCAEPQTVPQAPQ
jgi:hypothetical protein